MQCVEHGVYGLIFADQLQACFGSGVDEDVAACRSAEPVKLSGGWVDANLAIATAIGTPTSSGAENVIVRTGSSCSLISAAATCACESFHKTAADWARRTSK